MDAGKDEHQTPEACKHQLERFLLFTAKKHRSIMSIGWDFDGCSRPTTLATGASAGQFPAADSQEAKHHEHQLESLRVFTAKRPSIMRSSWDFAEWSCPRPLAS